MHLNSFVRKGLMGFACVAVAWLEPSCNKGETATKADCLENATTLRTITNADGTVRLVNGNYFIIEKNTIDTRLLPCSLATEFKVDGLPVKFSGTAKQRNQSNNEPCCTEGLILLSIAK